MTFFSSACGSFKPAKASTIIRYDPTYRYVLPRDQVNQGIGYDGQFAYYIALDPSKARYYLDDPSYRYERVLYPMLARFTALEQPAAVPWTLLIITWLGCGGGVLALAAWLWQRGASPWWAAIYGLYPGMLVGIQFDLTEPLAYGLVALAIYLFDFGGRRGVIASGAAFGLAAITRETTLLFAILFGLSILAGRPNANPRHEPQSRLRQALGFFALAVGPFVVWAAIDYSWLGLPHKGTENLTLAPFSGILADPLHLTRQPLELAFVAVPALLFSAAQLQGLRSGAGRLERLCLLANTAWIVVFSGSEIWASYTSIGRLAIAIVLSAVLCVPYLPAGALSTEAHGSAARVTAIVVSAFALWMAMLPGVIYYGFTRPRVDRGHTAVATRAEAQPSGSARPRG